MPKISIELNIIRQTDTKLEPKKTKWTKNRKSLTKECAMFHLFHSILPTVSYQPSNKAKHRLSKFS